MKVFQALIVMMTLGLTGCGVVDTWMGNNTGDGGSSGTQIIGPTGCIQGTVIDAITADPIPLPAASSSEEKGVFVLVRGQLIGASRATKSQGDATAATNLVPAKGDRSALAGEYTLCGIPLDETFPLFVWVDDYLEFQSEVRVDSKKLHVFRKTATQRADERETVVEGELEDRNMPTELANVRLFKRGTNAADMKFVITSAGTPVANAMVQIEPMVRYQSDANREGALPDDHFLPPSGERVRTLRAKTDDSGVVLFEAGSLVLGANYRYWVLPQTDGSYNLDTSATAVATNSAQFQYGLTTSVSGKNHPYTVFVDLDHLSPKVTLLATSLEHSNYHKDGVVELHFNRPVKIVDGTTDNIVASLHDKVWAELQENVDHNNTSEQVNVEFYNDNKSIRLSPVFEAGKEPDATTEYGLKVRYHGLSLQAIDGNGQKIMWTPEDAGVSYFEVSFFGGETLSVPTTLDIDKLVWNDAFVGASDIFTIVVRDQNGSPRADTPVNISVGSDSGTIADVTDGSYVSDNDVVSSYVPAVTDQNGRVRVKWKLGQQPVTQTLTVAMEDDRIEQQVIRAYTRLPDPPNPERLIVDLPLWSGIAGDGERLFTATLLDQNGNAYSNASIVIETGTDCGSLSRNGVTETETRLELTANSQGQVQFNWKVGTTLAEQNLEISAPGYSSVPVLIVKAEVTITPPEPNPDN